MLKRFLLLTVMAGMPLLSHSQANVYSSAAEKTQGDMTLSHVIGNVVTMESEDGTLSTGALSQYAVAVITGEELTGLTLLSVYPNPTKDVLVLNTGEMKNLTMTLTNAEGKRLLFSNVSDSETAIDFSRYTSGLYHLTLTRGKSIVKVFSIVKE